MLVRTLAGGWTISGIYTYGSGTPIPVISSLCSATNSPLQGQCMPDVVPGGTSACNIGIGPGCTAIKYIDSTKFKNQTNISATSSPIYLIGNAPRTAPLTLRGPGKPEPRCRPPQEHPSAQGHRNLRLRGRLHQRLEQGHLLESRIDVRERKLRPDQQRLRYTGIARLPVRRAYQLLDPAEDGCTVLEKSVVLDGKASQAAERITVLLLGGSAGPSPAKTQRYKGL
jgi:hypothetical protein